MTPSEPLPNGDGDQRRPTLVDPRRDKLRPLAHDPSLPPLMLTLRPRQEALDRPLDDRSSPPDPI